MRADAVFSGGGVKGLAFAGAIQAAEEAGYDEWDELGGTSAGAIAAMALAVGYDAAGLKKLFAFDFSKIEDTGLPVIGLIRNYFRHGIVRGVALTKWIESILAGAPRSNGGKTPTVFGDLTHTLKVVGADLVHQRMVVFPDDAGKYLDDHGQPYTPATFPIATAVRISAGYPGYFPPIELTDAATRTKGALVDGGVCSTLPVFLFDKSSPDHPTWAFRIFDGFAPEQPADHPIKGLLWPKDLLVDVIDTSINTLDDFELKSFPGRVIAIPTGTISVLDFALTQEQKDFLFKSGYDTAKKFFEQPPAAPTNMFGKTPAMTGVAGPGA